MNDSLGVYLAGPKFFLTDAVAIGAAKKALCAKRGLDGLFPFDNEVSPTPGLRIDQAIYRANVAMMRIARFGVFNLTPFRGFSADVGTVFELGMMIALGKPCFGYTNVSGSMLDRLKSAAALSLDPATGRWSDAAGMAVEDFGNADNLMITASLEASGSPIIKSSAAQDRRFRDLSGFEACLDAILSKLHADVTPETKP